jgi:hypothetical protein
MRRSRKPVWAVSSIEGSNPSLSAEVGRSPAPAGESGRFLAGGWTGPGGSTQANVSPFAWLVVPPAVPPSFPLRASQKRGTSQAAAGLVAHSVGDSVQQKVQQRGLDFLLDLKAPPPPCLLGFGRAVGETPSRTTRPPRCVIRVVRLGWWPAASSGCRSGGGGGIWFSAMSGVGARRDREAFADGS